MAPAVYDHSHGWQYSEWTCITFAVNLASTTLSLNALSYFGFIHLQRLPQSGLQLVDANVMGWAVFADIMLTASVNLVSAMGVTKCLRDICGKLQGPFYKHVLEPISQAINKHVLEPTTRAINNIHGFKAMFRFAPFGLDSTSCKQTEIKTECNNDACPCKDKSVG